jgi:pyruvate/2-oxoglutarate dehydrogenase complex dihydrolipoamide dehydrogenase (E3) component
MKDHAQMTMPDDPGQSQSAQDLPPGWANPRPQRGYDLVVIGGTRVGVAAALAAVERGARVALVARDLGYEDHSIRWLSGSSAAPEFAETSARWRQQLDRQLPLWELLGYGVDVFFGPARFVGPRALEVDDVRLEFLRAVLASGPRCTAGGAAADPAPFLTPEALARIESPPRRLLVVGDGSQACEIAQAFCRLGSEVHLAAGSDGILPRADRRAADWLLDRLTAEGVRVYRGWKISNSSRSGRWQSVVLQRQDQRQELIAEHIVEAGESQLSLGALDPVAAGIRCGSRGVEINRRLQTSNPAIIAVGHAAGQQFLAGAATAVGRMAAGNALARWRKAADPLLVGSATYTDPQVAHVGLTISQLDAAQVPVESHWLELDVPDGCDGEECAGLAIALLAPKSGRLLGLTIVAKQAALLAAEISARLSGGRRLNRLAEGPALSAEHEHALRQIIAACRAARV